MATPSNPTPSHGLEILQQIQDLVQQYLSLPEDTPLKTDLEHFSQTLQDGIDSYSGDVGSMGQGPPESGMSLADLLGGGQGGPGGPPDQGGPPGLPGPPGGGPPDMGPMPEMPSKSFAGARAQAKTDIASARKESGGTKGIPPQFSKNKKSAKGSAIKGRATAP